MIDDIPGKNEKKSTKLWLVIIILIIITCIVIRFRATIFQEGNPIRFVGAMYRLEIHKNKIIEVPRTNNRFLLAKRKDTNNDVVLKSFLKKRYWIYVDQQGSELIFVRNDSMMIVYKRLYMGGHYIIYELTPQRRRPHASHRSRTILGIRTEGDSYLLSLFD